MKCFHHTNNDSVGTCNDCNKGLCIECASAFEIPICDSCNTKRIDKEKSDIFLEFGIIFLAAIGGSIILISTTNEEMTIITLFLGPAVIYGWKAFNKYIPFQIERGTLVVWVLYLFIKFMISVLLGFITVPYMIFKNIKRLNEISKIPIQRNLTASSKN